MCSAPILRGYVHGDVHRTSSVRPRHGAGAVRLHGTGRRGLQRGFAQGRQNHRLAGAVRGSNPWRIQGVGDLMVISWQFMVI